MTCIYTRHLYLDAAAKAALCASDTDGLRHASRIKDVRKNLIAALSGCKAGDTDNAEGLLLDLISGAIADSFDVDWRPEDAARVVLDWLLDEVAPTPKPESEAA
jgi:hypothetical protein